MMFAPSGPYRFRAGSSPLVVSMPHVGTVVVPALARAMTAVSMQRPDTDWHLPRLYDFLGELGASVIAATHSRYAVDLNRPPGDESLYPGRVTTGLVAHETFHGEALYRDGRVPDASEVARRLEAYWKPYHRRLENELQRVRAQYGIAILWDAHSIVSMAPRLFEGRLADFNLGTADGKSCDAALARVLHDAMRKHSAYTVVLDGRFKGGYITRRYGRPADGIHAVQLEMSERIYMEEQCPFTFREDRARDVRPILREQLEIALRWAA
jgi:N-formylglutamate deformylase